MQLLIDSKFSKAQHTLILKVSSKDQMLGLAEILVNVLQGKQPTCQKHIVFK